jgi:hypothetical protein
MLLPKRRYLTLSISFTSKPFLGICIGLVFLSGCAAARKNAVESPQNPILLKVQVPSPDRPAPQAARMTTIRWSAVASGGVGPRTFEFWSFDGQEEVGEQKGFSTRWDWTPNKAGTYKVKVVVLDSLGNRVESSWSQGYEVAPPLVVEAPVPDQQSPQAPRLKVIRWSAAASGGVGGHAFEFTVTDGKEENRGQESPSSIWEWRPKKVGTYRMKAVVRDALGNRAESGWSFQYSISNEMVYTVPIAVLPVENLSGSTAPLEKIRELLVERLKKRGFSILDENILEEFMARHRMRHTGGMEKNTARAFVEETGAGAVFITSLELYNDKNPPKIALTSRLVSTGDPVSIIWMDSVGMAGDDAPGILDLGLIENSLVLLGKALQSLSGSFAGYLTDETAGDSPERKRKKFRPKYSYRSPDIDMRSPRTLAVLPFFNESVRKYAGEIMKLHFVRELTKMENIEVIEPGVIRKELLNYRIIMDDGISLSQTDVVGSVLDVDLLLTGEVLDYQDYQGPSGTPVVDFSLMLIERKNREVLWASKSYNKGTDGVYFFDWGRERTASEMASEMARIVGEKFGR